MCIKHYYTYACALCEHLGRSPQLDESSDEARHIRQLEQLLEQKESEMVRWWLLLALIFSTMWLQFLLNK